MNPMARPALLASILAVMGGAPSADARTRDGVSFPDSVQVRGKTLVLNGIGVRSATFLKIKVYVASLYVEAKTTRANEVLRPDRTKRFVAVFRRDVSRDQGASTFKQNLTRAAGAQAPLVAKDIEAFAHWIPAVSEGQQLVATYIPGQGLSVTTTAAATPFAADERFGSIVFRLWIGPTADPDLRQGLMGLDE